MHWRRWYRKALAIFLVGALLLTYLESRQLVNCAPMIYVGMPQADVEGLLSPPVSRYLHLRAQVRHGGDLTGGMARGAETAAYFKEWEDDSAWVQVGFDEADTVSGFWMAEHAQSWRWEQLMPFRARR